MFFCGKLKPWQMPQITCKKPLLGQSNHRLARQKWYYQGSQSDWATMSLGVQLLADFGVPFECEVVSAHRTPDKLFDYAKSAKDKGLQVIIAGAGGAAHLPGMCASQTELPVLGVPVKSFNFKWLGQLVIYRSDAKRHCGRDFSH